MPQTKERFEKLVNKTPSCWLWSGSKTRYDYGLYKVNKKTTTAHRVAYMLYRGEIPRGLHLDHLCNNRLCVNPDHLEAVTQKENNLRAKDGFAYLNSIKIRCPSGHPFDDKNTYIKPNGNRNCRTCRREALRQFRQRRLSHGR